MNLIAHKIFPLIEHEITGNTAKLESYLRKKGYDGKWYLRLNSVTIENYNPDRTIEDTTLGHVLLFTMEAQRFLIMSPVDHEWVEDGCQYSNEGVFFYNMVNMEGTEYYTHPDPLINVEFAAIREQYNLEYNS